MSEDRVLFLWPHHDDDVLWTAFSLMAEVARGSRLTCVTVFESHVQAARGTGITQETRWAETEAALVELGVLTPPMTRHFGAWEPSPWRQWAFRDDAPPFESELALEIFELCGEEVPARVYAPAFELGGHVQHNLLGLAALRGASGGRLIQYLTYTKRGKSCTGIPVPYEPWMVTRKLRALACYESQIENPGALSTAHFMESLHEYIAE